MGYAKGISKHRSRSRKKETGKIKKVAGNRRSIKETCRSRSIKKIFEDSYESVSLKSGW